MNIAVISVDLVRGMAETQHVRNMFHPLQEKHNVSIYNLRERKMECIDILTAKRHEPIGIRTYLSQTKQEKGKLLFVYGYPNLKNILTIFLFMFYGFKVVFHITEDLRYQVKTYTFKGNVNIKASLLFVHFIHWLSSGSIVISKLLEQRIKKLANNNYPLLYLPISTDIENIKAQKPEDIKSDPTAHKFFYGGTFAPKDGIEIIIKAFEKIYRSNKNAQLILTGKAVDIADERIVKQLILDSLAHKNIHFKGYLPYNEYLQELWGADALIMNRVDDIYSISGFPFKLGEYLATGKIIIASALSSVREFLTDKKNALLFKPESVEELAAAFQYSIDHKKDMDEIASEAEKVAWQHFDNQKHAVVLMDFFKRIKVLPKE